MKPVVLIAVSSLAVLALYAQKEADAANMYTNSAHGSSSYGVLRNPIPATGFARGNCAHCHEQHASIGGSEPLPRDANPYGAPSNDLLFYDSWKSQTDGFCFMCHTNTSSYQSGGIVNRSYSYRAGGWTADTVNDTKGEFGLASAHNLSDIRSFISNAARSSWGYNSKSDPCSACHNSHAAKGDPANSGNATKSAGTRGWLVSLPSLHGNTKTWALWGDDASEKMNNYTASYQAPYRFGSTTLYEPDGSTTTNGSNLTDFNTFCTDCHNSTNSITSTPLGGTLKTIDWSATGEKHGKANADGSINVDAPYTATMGWVLSCMDCHEAHGSANAFLIRREANGVLIAAKSAPTVPMTIASFASGNWGYLCNRCHKDDAELIGGSCYNDAYYGIHHDNGTVAEAPYPAPGTCNVANCHSSNVAWSSPACNTPINQIICSQCHFHGSQTSGGTIPNAYVAPTSRRTF